MGPYLLEKRTSCWWRHETMRNIYYVEFNFLNLKYYVFEMFLPNFNRIEWKIEKRQLFQNSCRFSTFYTNLRKDDVMSDVIVDLIRIFFRKLFILSQSSSVQNLSSLTLNTKELWRGVENTTRQKSPVLIWLNFLILFHSSRKLL